MGEDDGPSCTLIPISHSNRRASPGSEQATYRLIVRAHEGGGLEEVSSCSGCTYFVSQRILQLL